MITSAEECCEAATHDTWRCNHVHQLVADPWIRARYKLEKLENLTPSGLIPFSSQDWGPWTKVWSGSSIRTSVDPRGPHSTTGGQDCTSSLRTTLTTLTTLAILRSGPRDDPQSSIALLGSRTRQGSCGGRSLLGPRSRGGGHPCLLAQLCGTYPSPCGIPLCCSNSLVRPLEGPCPCPCPHPCSCTAPCSSSCACSRICSRFDAQHTTNPYLLCFIASCVSLCCILSSW